MIGRALGWLSGIGFVAVMLAGSDWPPPPGFVVVVAVGVALGVVVAKLLPRVLALWELRGAWAALWRTAAAGLAAGAVGWAVLLALPFTGEPSVEPDLAQLAIGVVIVAVVAAIGATVIVVVGRVLSRVVR